MDIRHKNQKVTLATGKGIFDHNNPAAYEDGLKSICSILGVAYAPHHERRKMVESV